VRVVVAEDHFLLRDGLIRLLAAYGHEVVAAVDNGPELLSALVAEKPDVAIVDVRLPPDFGDEGLRAALAARARVPGLPVLLLSQYVEPLYARELLADGAGAVGYVLKDRVTNGAAFLADIGRVADGGTVLDPEVVSQLLARKVRDQRLGSLTAREREVLGLLAQGRSNAGVAEALFFALLVEGPPPALDGPALTGYACLALINTALAYWLWFRGIGRLGATRATLLGPLSPLTAAVIGWAALGQQLTALQVAGTVLALGATVLGQRAPRPRGPAAPAEPGAAERLTLGQEVVGSGAAPGTGRAANRSAHNRRWSSERPRTPAPSASQPSGPAAITPEVSAGGPSDFSTDWDMPATPR
jgi:DNA-binding NarL/FixJ family response regulator